MRKLLGRALLGALSTIAVSTAGYAATYNLSVDYVTIDTGDMKTKALAITGPRPVRPCASKKAKMPSST